ncbi:MAG: hypothetical protein IH959_04505, partial [Chloroflexi bacterium]|nr:hypothetical protein [Chloroflexota bacterium]
MTKRALMRPPVLLALLTIFLGALLLASGRSVLGQEPTPTPTASPPATATISGVVFDDLDGNGVRDDGEPGLPDKAVTLVEGATLKRAVRTEADGSYSMDGLAPGEYVLNVVLHSGAGLCAEYGTSFNPFVASWC